MALSKNRISQLIRTICVLPIHFYQHCISPLTPPHCRFQPTCSSYTIEAIEKYGVIRGILKGIGRILRCHPLSKGGWDPP